MVNSIKSKTPSEIKKQVYKILKNINKPSKYIGAEMGSLNKNWDDCSVRAAIAFPDMYEVGISNLGLKILYHLINNNKDNPDFYADRVYAPGVDFKEELIKNKIPLYGVETFRSIQEFDVLAFSLQYELSYPTILAMLDMGNIPIKSVDRDDNSPIIIAGGPGSYNPKPINEFIDAFIIGDGEDVLIEILELIKTSKNLRMTRQETLKNLSKLEGVYVPSFYDGSVIIKRIAQLKPETSPDNFPVPYSPSIHDRAVVEIRRGCGRMCRFCQPCFVNLPIREREPEDIKNKVRNLLGNTGYDEYSLLSLSSNDYKNIEKLVCSLNDEHAPKGASVSLPSQRADSFSLDLANEVQKVRKSTITFAPEAGSQRLRNVINKNLTEENIIKPVMDCYKAGWKKVKLYFMIGLPTETYEDIEAIVELIKKIKYIAKQTRRESGLNHHLDINATVSIFVPKPFTPFAWCGQDSKEVLENKIDFLKQKAKFVKGLKLNIHDFFLSELEAAFTRGDENLNNLIFTAYKKGSYLDAWDEHFNKTLWRDSAIESGIDIQSYSTKEFTIDEEMPWEFISTGVSKDWLVEEYQNALKESLRDPCDIRCVNCGVCKNLNQKKVLKSTQLENVKYEPKEQSLQQDKEKIKYRIKLTKNANLKYISHLDWQSTFHKVVKKLNLSPVFSQGFNPTPKISLGVALPIFVEGENEYVDIELYDDINENELKEKFNVVLPEGARVKQIVKISKDVKPVDSLVEWGLYKAVPIDKTDKNEINLVLTDILDKKEIFIEKINKKGLRKQIDIRPSIKSIKLFSDTTDSIEFILKSGQANSQEFEIRPLRADDFINLLPNSNNWEITRIKLFDKDLKEIL